MSYHLMILREDEYQEIKKERLERRRDERQRKQWEAERPYDYPKEKQAELLKQRDLSGELKTLKRRKKGVVIALWLLAAVFGMGCGRMIKAHKGKMAIACEAVAVSLTGVALMKWRSYDRKIRMKKDEIVYANAGWINPGIELFRQEGKAYY